MSGLVEFSRLWSSPDCPPVPVSADQIGDAQQALVFSFPDTWRRAVLDVGLPRPTSRLWAAIDASGRSLARVAAFLTPAEMVEARRAGDFYVMPADLVPFATDSDGDLIAFRRGAGNDAVWLFDLDLGTTEQLSPSFDAWLASYADLAPVPERG